MVKCPARCLCLVLLIAVASTRPARAGNADVGPVVNPGNGHSYYVSEAQTTWAEAETWAISLGGHLVAINDAAEDTWMQANLGVSSGYYWLGGSDDAVEGTFEWVTGEPFSHQNFLPGEPDDDFASGGLGDYLALSATDWAWLDTNGNFTGFVTGAIAEVAAPVGIGPPPADRGGIHFAALPSVTGDFTRLEFTLPRAASVSCRIFDVRGRRVRTLAGGAFGAGQHDVTWDTRDDGSRRVPGGVYLVQLRVDGDSSTRKVIVTR